MTEANYNKTITEQQPNQKLLRQDIMDWVHETILFWGRQNSRVPTKTISVNWMRDPRLSLWAPEILELNCANYEGNLLGLSYAIGFEQLVREYQSEKPFQLPSERFWSVPKEALSLTCIPGEMTILPGVFYEKLGNQLYGTGPRLDVQKSSQQATRYWLVLESVERAPHLLVRFVDYDSGLGAALHRPRSAVNCMLGREDILSHVSRTYMGQSGIVTELYLLLNCRDAFMGGYLLRHEDLMVEGSQLVDGDLPPDEKAVLKNTDESTGV